MTAHLPYGYAPIADTQIDELEIGPDAVLYDAVVDLCESILENPSAHRESSAVIRSNEGLRFRTPVPGGFPYKVFWSLTGDSARIEALFSYDA